MPSAVYPTPLQFNLSRLTGRGPVHRHVTAMILIALLSMVLFARARRVEIDIDESSWISAGLLTRDLVAERQPPSEWVSAYERRGLGEWGNLNPPIGKLLIGVFAHPVRQPGDTVAYAWTWGQTLDWNRRYGRLAPRHLLQAARTGIAWTGVLSLVLAYAIAVQLVGARWIALWAPLALFGNPGFRAHSAIAYTNIPQLCLLLLAVFLFLRFLRGARTWWLVLAAMAMGLACAIKFNAAAIVVGALFFVLVFRSGVSFFAGRWSGRRAVGGLCLLLLPPAVFVAVNPYLYPAPIERTVALVHNWSLVTAEQQRDPLLADLVVPTRAEAVRLMLTRALVSQEHASPYGQMHLGSVSILELAGLLFLFPLLRRSWRERTAPLPLLTALLVCVIGFQLLYDRWGGVCVLLLLVGLAASFRVRHDHSNLDTAHVGPGFLATVFVSFAILTTMWLPFDWARYYLPVAVWIPFLQVVGLSDLMPLQSLAAAVPSHAARGDTAGVRQAQA